MRRLAFLSLGLVSILASATQSSVANEPLAAIADKIAPLVREHFPDAVITRDEKLFSASHGTTEFMVHPRQRDGKILATPEKVQGPNYKGFTLQIRIQPGRYAGAAIVPQDLKEPYWTTHIDGPTVPGQDSHYWISFSYGGRLDEKFKTTLLDALPATKLGTR